MIEQRVEARTGQSVRYRFYCQEVRGVGCNGIAHEALHQAQAQSGPCHQASGADDIAVIEQRLLSLGPGVRVTRLEYLHMIAVSACSASIQQTTGRNEEYPDAHAGQNGALLMQSAQSRTMANQAGVVGNGMQAWRDDQNTQSSITGIP